MTELKVISTAEVEKHRNKENGVWMIIHNDIYDVTSFLEEHPGGEESLMDVAGQEATQDFEDVGHSDDARELMKKYVIGTLPPEEKKKTGGTLRPDDKFNIPPCCPHLPRSTEKTWRTFDGSSSSRSLPLVPVKSEYKPPTTPRPEGRVNAIYVPKERRPRGRPCESGGKREEPPPPRSNLKWAVVALAGALVVGIVLKKYLSK